MATLQVTRARCPLCGELEVPCFNTPFTVYSCGTQSYDERPGTFKMSDYCKSKGSQRSGHPINWEILCGKWLGGMHPESRKMATINRALGLANGRTGTLVPYSDCWWVNILDLCGLRK